LTANESFNGDFYVKNVLPIVNRDGKRLIGDNFTFQQDGSICDMAYISMAYMAKRIKKQIYSSQKLGIELFNIFEYIQTYSLFPKSSLYFIQTFDYSIYLNIFKLIHFIQKSILKNYSDIQIFNNSI